MSCPPNPKCRDCDLWKTSTNVCIPGDGSKTAKVMIIGEAPGKEEANTGKPFMGKSGQLLRGELRRVGLNDVYITNVVKCRPPENRTPTPDEIKACRKYLDYELETIKPEFVIPAGAVASKSVLKKAKITEVHGRLIPMPGFTGAPIFHPAYCLRDMSKLPAFQKDLERISRAVKGEVRRSTVRWTIVTRDTLTKFFQEFEAAEEFAFDLETSGLFPYDGKGLVRCIGIALPNRAWILPLEGVDQIGIDDSTSEFRGRHRIQKTIIQMLVRLSKGKIVVGQNAKFDNHWLMCNYGVRFHLNFDTMLAHHILDENGDHDLKSLVRAYLDEPDYDLTTAEKKGQTTNTKLFEYCAKDCAYTLRLYRVFNATLKKNKPLRRLFYKLVMPAARALTEIEEVGLTVNTPQMDIVESETRTARDEALKQLNRMATEARKGKKAIKKVNWNSPQQIARLLFQDLGLKPTVKTAKGRPSTGEEALLDIKDKHPVAAQLVKYRELDKFLGTYIEGWKEHMVGNLLFLGYKIHGTVTGRYSSRLHQVPRDGRIRNLVTAPPGWTFVQGDISQAEMRTAATLSGDLELIRCFKENIDVHWRTFLYTLSAGAAGEYVKPAIDTAKKLVEEGAGIKTPLSLTEAIDILLEMGPDEAVAIDKSWKEARKKAKAVNFGYLFGMFEKKFIETCKLKYGFEPTMKEAERSRQAYFSLYRGLKSWHDKQKKLAHLDGFVRSLTGRLRRLPGVHSGDWGVKSEAERQAINSPVQGFIGDYKAMCLVEIHETVPKDKFKLVGEHHDAILGIVRNDAIEEVLPQVQRIMRKPRLLEEFQIDLTVPMEADLELGPWGAGKPWKGEKSPEPRKRIA